MKKFLAVFLALLFVMCALCGCSGTTSTTGTVSDETAASSGAAEITEMIVGIPNDLDSLDPYSMGKAGTREVMYNVFEGLVKIQSDGSYADAVAAFHNISEDGLTYTFTLRDDARFHNGKAVTTDDVLYSLNKACAESTSTSAAVKSALSAAEITVEGNDIVLTLAEQNSDLLACLSCAYIVPADYENQAAAPVGTGPFKFVSYSVQDSFVVEKFAEYYGTPAYLDKVTFRIFSSSNAGVLALQSGAIDMMPHLNWDDISQLGDEYTVLDGTMNLAVALYLNNSVAPLDNVLVRQALCYAVDVDEVMDVVCNGKGVKIGSSMFPNFAKYFDASLADNYSYNVEKAKELLSEAGYANGFDFEIKYPAEYATFYGNMALVIQQQLKQVNINVTVTSVEDWYTEVYKGHNFEGMIVGFDTSLLTAGGMLQRWSLDTYQNMISYNNAEYNATLAAAKEAAHDDELQTRLYKQCLEILSEDAASVYIQDLPDFVVISPAYTGYEFFPLYILDMSVVRPAS